MEHTGTLLRVRGKVQGVGFRPWVWQLAQELTLNGDVCNDGEGVLIRVDRDAAALKARLLAEVPPLARIDEIYEAPWGWATVPVGFTIRASAHGEMATQIAPDAATCPECLREMNDPQQRRYRYPFINCTHCGPRFTIIRAMPYDRPLTCMAAFPLCAACDAEYQNPADRRFHAQPIACPQCGPQLSWQQGDESLNKEAALQAAIAALARGEILAIKGLGGFHLACDALNERAVKRLRLRKQRPTKPLAVMLPDKDIQCLPTWARTLLNSPAAPIVLVNKRWLSLCEAIAPGLVEVGVLRPSNPLQHLLSQALARPLVMTSGNLSGHPPALSNAQAQQMLSGVADGWLDHDRDIVQRMDDSVLGTGGEMLRRARGFVPDRLSLPPGFEHSPALLCLGGDLKNTFCLVRDGQALLSQHFGNLSEEAVFSQWKQALAHWQDVWQFSAQGVVVDAHPGYRTTRFGEDLPLPLHRVLHHHAHAAACLVEHGWPRDAGDVIALTLDGIGYGQSGELWGGECLRVNYRACEKLGGLPPVALPGADAAAREPWRNLLAQWLAFVPYWQTLPQAAVLKDRCWQPLARAIARGVNAPRASSAGRLFDAVAAALGCAPDRMSYEGEAGCRLEALALSAPPPDKHPLRLTLRCGELDMMEFWDGWFGWQAGNAQRAWAFHDALARGLANLAASHARLRKIETIVCAGGVINNRLLRARLRFWLRDFHVLMPFRLPAGDGALSLGQAAIAAATFS